MSDDEAMAQGVEEGRWMKGWLGLAGGSEVCEMAKEEARW